jgi:hypothetical protein
MGEMIDKFHCHLDMCTQCEQHPFDLCPIGAALIKKAGSEAIEEMAIPIKEELKNGK